MRQPAEDPQVIHHALLNHVAIVSTYAHLLQDSRLDADQRELLAELLVSVEKAHGLATQLGLALEPGPDTKGKRG